MSFRPFSAACMIMLDTLYREDWKPLGRPMRIMRFKEGRSTLILEKENLCAPSVVRKCLSARPVQVHMDSTLAQAAPATFQPSAPTNSRSRAMFIKQLAIRYLNGLRLWPTPCRVPWNRL